MSDLEATAVHSDLAPGWLTVLFVAGLPLLRVWLVGEILVYLQGPVARLNFLAHSVNERID